jgi:hypothetical protein
MADNLTTPDRRQPGQQAKRRDGRRKSDRYMTVPEVAEVLGMQPRTIWEKYLRPKDGQQLLRYYDFHGEARVAIDDFEEFQRTCLRDRTATARHVS